MSEPTSGFLYTEASLDKLRLKRFRRLSNIVTIVAIAYAILVIQFTSLFKENRYFLEFFVLAAGVANYLIYRFLPDTFFKPGTFFSLNILNLFVIGFVVQITGGLASPFVFFYTIIILSAIVTMSLWRTAIIFILTIELIAAHFLTASNQNAIDPGSLANLMFNIARVIILGIYSVILVSDLFTEEKRNLLAGSQLREKFVESELTSQLDRSVASREPLGEILNRTLSETAKEFKADSGLLLLKDDLGGSWRAGATFQLSHEFTSKVIPETAEAELMKLVEKGKKTALLTKRETSKKVPSLEALEASALLISPFTFKGHLFGSIVLLKLSGNFESSEKDFFSRLTEKFSATVAAALDLEAQEHLFSETEKEKEVLKKKLAGLEEEMQNRTVAEREKAATS